MTVDHVVQLARLALQAAFWVSMPVLAAATVISLLINIAQVMTSIQDVTVTTVPRLTAVGVILFFLTPWMLNHLVSFTILLFADFRPYTR
ncbi:MAG: flagellar biosynthetic protein FliQ [Acidobacteriia bacterium]|nr:flagellar biosynthetic protein FliQ [Terriglobia bacterium]